MSDSLLQTFYRYGTDAERLAFTPDPPDISGSPVRIIYIWYVNTGSNSGNTYLYDTSWHLLSNSAVGSAITALTSDVTATGPGSVAATIANLAVTGAKIANSTVTLGKIAVAAANSKLIGSGSAGSGASYSELTLGTGLSMSGTTLNGTGAGAPTNAQYVTLATDGTLSDERVLTAGKNITVTDAGAGSTVTLASSIPLTNDGNSSTALTIDWTSKPRDEHRFTLTGNVTLTLSNPVDGGAYVLLIYTGAGSFSVTWPGTVKWPAGTAPTITVTASRLDLVTLIYDSTAAVYYGSFNQNYTP